MPAVTRSLCITAATAALLAACADQSRDPTAPHPTRPELAGKPGPSNPTATFYISNDAAYLLRGDGISTYLETTGPLAGFWRYKNGECGVVATIQLASGSGDATMGSADTRDAKCAAYPRKIRLTYARIADPSTGATTWEGDVVSTTGMNVQKLAQDVATWAIGATRTKAFNLSADQRCGDAGTAPIVFKAVLSDGTVTGADEVQVRRDAADTFTVYTPPDELDANGNTIHHDKAYCKANGQLYHIPVRLTVKTVPALAAP